MVPDVNAHGLRFVSNIAAGQAKPAKTLAFAGVACALPKHLRGAPSPGLRVDVIHSPIEPPDRWADPAHSNVIIFGSTTDDDLDAVRTYLQERLRVVREAAIPHLAVLCASAPVAAPLAVLRITASSSSGTGGGSFAVQDQ